MLWEEAEEFRRLSGEDPEETSIARIGGFLDGYERGKKSAEPEIVRCRDCKNWKSEHTGELKSSGLGVCSFHEASFVTSEGYCYWAKRRTDETN